MKAEQRSQQPQIDQIDHANKQTSEFDQSNIDMIQIFIVKQKNFEKSYCNLLQKINDQPDLKVFLQSQSFFWVIKIMILSINIAMMVKKLKLTDDGFKFQINSVGYQFLFKQPIDQKEYQQVLKEIGGENQSSKFQIKLTNSHKKMTTPKKPNFNQINEQVAMHDITFLRINMDELIKIIQKEKQNPSIQNSEYIKFKKIFKYKIRLFPQHVKEALFSNLIKHLNLNNLNIQNQTIQDHVNDQLFYSYLKMQKDSSQKDALIHRISMANYTKQSKYQWREIYRIVSRLKSTHHSNSVRLPCISCLGCIPYFLQGQTISDNQQPFTIFPSISTIQKYQAQLKDFICYYLNNGGGIILFDCQQELHEVYPKGAKINFEKEKYQQKIKSYISSIYPSAFDQVTISFVALRKIGEIIEQKYKGEEAILKRDKTYKTYPFKQDYYITRIRVRPNQALRGYFWSQTKEEAHFCLKHPQSRQRISTEKKIKKLKQKFKNNCKQPKICPKFIDIFDHECKKQDTMQIQPKKQPYLNEPQKQFNNIAFLFANKDDHQQIVEQLKQKGIQSKIQRKFIEYKFKYSAKYAVLHFNCDISKLLNVGNKIVLKKKNNRFNIVEVTPWLELPQPLINQKQQLRKLVNKQFNQLQTFQFKYLNGKHYIKTEKKLVAVLLFYVLHHKNLNVKFKCPQISNNSIRNSG